MMDPHRSYLLTQVNCIDMRQYFYEHTTIQVLAERTNKICVALHLSRELWVTVMQEAGFHRFEMVFHRYDGIELDDSEREALGYKNDTVAYVDDSGGFAGLAAHLQQFG